MMEYYLSKNRMKIDFLTLKGNRGVKFQKMDPVRKLLDKHYLGYVIVGSPKGGRHWHALAHREGKRSIKVPRGTHFRVTQVGTLHRSTKNKTHEDPYEGDASIQSQILTFKPPIKPIRVAKGAGFSSHLASVLFYLLENLLENESLTKYQDIHIKY